MREIKFRVWDSTPGYELMTATVSLADIEKGFNVSGKNRTVMQWTGLTDRNGVEIYEGDILRVFVKPYYSSEERKSSKDLKVVEWNAATLGWNMRPIQGRYEVIGNIWENGDLLK